MLWIRPPRFAERARAAGTEGAVQPFWSPDSRSVGFFASGKLKRIDASSGPPQTLADAPFPLGGSWSAAGVIVFGEPSAARCFRSPPGAAPSRRRPVSNGGQARRRRMPRRTSSRTAVISSSSSAPVRSTGDLYVGSLDSKDIKVLCAAIPPACTRRPDISCSAANRRSWRSHSTSTTLSVRGEAVAVAESVGTYFHRDHLPRRRIRDAGVQAVGDLADAARLGGPHRPDDWDEPAPAGSYEEMALSADDKRVAFSRPGQGDADVWLTDLERGITSRFTFQAAVQQRADLVAGRPADRVCLRPGQWHRSLSTARPTAAARNSCC